MSNVYPVTSTRRRKGAERGRETSLPGPYETCRTLFKTLTSKVAVLLYVAIFSVYGQAVAQCPTSVTLQVVSGQNACTTAGTNTACITLRATTNVAVQSGTVANFYRNTVFIGSTTASTTTTTFDLNYCGATPGTAGYDVTITNISPVGGGTCSDVISGAPALQVTTVGTPVVGAIAATRTETCANQSTTVNVTVTGPVAGTVSVCIQDAVTNQVFCNSVPANSSGTTVVPINVAPVQTGTHTFTVTSINTTGAGATCPGVGVGSQTTVQVYPNVPVSVTDPTPNPTCSGSSILIQMNGLASVAGPTTVTWYKVQPSGASQQIIPGASGQGGTYVFLSDGSLRIDNSQPGDAGTYYAVVCGNAATYGPCNCETTRGVTVVVNPSPQVTLGPGPGTICAGSNSSVPVTLTQGGTGTVTVYYTITSSAGGTTTGTAIIPAGSTTTSIPLPTAVAGRTYTVTVTQLFQQGTNCGNAFPTGSEPTATVVVNDYGFTAAPATTPVCFGATTAIRITTAQGAGSSTVTYVLNGPGASNVTLTRAGNATGTFTGSYGPGTYTVQGTVLNGCTVTQTVTIAQQEQINLTTQTVAPINCFGGTTTITATPSFANTANVDPAAGSTFTLTLATPGGTILSQQAGVASNTTWTFPVPVGAGTYSITAASATCTVQQTLIVNQPQPIVVNATPGVSPVPCYNATTTIFATAGGGAAAGTYTFTLSGGPSAGTQTFTAANGANGVTFTNVSPGTYTVTARDQNGCVGTAFLNIANPPQLVIGNVQTTQPSCPGGQGSISIQNVSGGTGNYRYSLSGSLVNASTATSTNNFTFSNLGVGTYTPTVIDANGCTVVAQAVTIVPPSSITGNVTFTQPQCYGETSTVTISSIAGGNGGTMEFRITGTNATTGQPINPITMGPVAVAPGGSVQIGGVPAGTYSITANNTNCPAQPIGTNLSPVGNLVIQQPVAITVAGWNNVQYTPTCNPTSGTVTLTATAGGGNTFTYTLINASTGQVVETNNTGVFTNLQTGTYNFQVRNNTTGCVQQNNITAGQQVVVNVPTAFTISVASNAATCIGGTGTITATPSGGTGSVVYTLQTPSGGTMTNTTGVFNVPAGTYTVTATRGVCANQNGPVGSTVGGQPAQPSDLLLNASTVNMVGTSTPNATFTGAGSQRQVTYTIINTQAASGIAVWNPELWISRTRPDMTITLTDPANWQLISSGPSLVRYRYIGQLPCGNATSSVSVGVIYGLTTNLGPGTFSLSATAVNPAGDPFEYNNGVAYQVATTQ